MLAFFDSIDQILCRLLGEARELKKVLFGEFVDILKMFYEPLRVEKLHVFFSKSFDLHAAARGKMRELLLYLCRAMQGYALDCNLAFFAHNAGAAGRAFFRQGNNLLVSAPLILHDHDDVRDDITSAFDENSIADPDILSPDLIPVVERGAGDRNPADLYRLKDRKRSDNPGPADTALNIPDYGLSLMGLEFVCFY